jgi:hypothetical protein
MRYLRQNQNDKFWYELFAAWSFIVQMELRRATLNLDIVVIKSVLRKDANPKGVSLIQIKMEGQRERGEG